MALKMLKRLYRLSCERVSKFIIPFQYSRNVVKAKRSSRKGFRGVQDLSLAERLQD